MTAPGAYAADLRGIPLRALETAILSGQERIASRAAVPAPDLSTLASYYATTFGPQAKHWVADSYHSQTSQGKRLQAARRPGRLVKHSHVPPLAAPSKGLTDEFLAHVAAAYSAAVASGKQPGPELARQADRPVKTVHRWIYTARKRGIMQAGRPGSVQS
jgi:hypothetical protein